jgi:hypothetical protein
MTPLIPQRAGAACDDELHDSAALLGAMHGDFLLQQVARRSRYRQTAATFLEPIEV